MHSSVRVKDVTRRVDQPKIEDRGYLPPCLYRCEIPYVLAEYYTDRSLQVYVKFT